MRTNFIETSWGGHRIFWIEFSGNIQQGPGQWCLDTDSLKAFNYVNYIKDNWEEFREYRKDFENAKIGGMLQSIWRDHLLLSIQYRKDK